MISKYFFLTISKYFLNVVYYDICGPFEVPSIAGSKYFLTYVDEYSGMLWMYLIKAKSEALEIFKEIKLMEERQSGRRLKILGSIYMVGVNKPPRTLKSTAPVRALFMRSPLLTLHNTMMW